MKCSKCGCELDSQDSFCFNCGTKVEATPVSQVNNANPINYGKKNNKPLLYGIIIGLLILIIVLLVLIINKKNAIQVPETGLKEGKSVSRTVMIYMDGADLESRNRIASSDLDGIDPDEVDLKNTKILVYTGGTKKWHNFVSNNENAIYELKSDGFEKVKSFSKKNMGDDDTLAEFLEYGYDNYKTDRYDLMFWNHGGAVLGAIFDDFTEDNLSVSEFEKGLKKSPFNKKKLETIIFRTCLNSTIEVANSIKDYSYYMVASEEVTIGGRGYSVLEFLNDVEPTDSAIDYGKKFIDSYAEQTEKLERGETGTTRTYSIIDLTKLDALNKSIDKFFDKIDLKKNYSDITRLRAGLYQFAYTNDGTAFYDTIDLYELVNGISLLSGVDAKEFNDAFANTIVYNWTNLDFTNGLAIYFPYRGEAAAQQYFMTAYRSFDYSDEYKDFIKEYYNLSHSNGKTSFSNFSMTSENVIIESSEAGKSASIELSDKQVSDYASSTYIIFHKENDGLYKPVYSSDNATLKNNKLTTNIQDNLIKIYDKSDNTELYLTLVERGYREKRKSMTSAIAVDTDADVHEIDNFMIPVNVYFDFEDNVPYIKNLVHISDTNKDSVGGISKVKVDMSKIDSYEFMSSSYDILDENGKYTSAWDNKGNIGIIAIDAKNMEFRKSTLDDGEYYCVFTIYDIYGNKTYSDLVSLN